MPPRQITQFFKPFGQTKKHESEREHERTTTQDAVASLSNASRAPHRSKALVLSPKRAWPSPDVQKRKDSWTGAAREEMNGDNGQSTERMRPQGAVPRPHVVGHTTDAGSVTDSLDSSDREARTGKPRFKRPKIEEVIHVIPRKPMGSTQQPKHKAKHVKPAMVSKQNKRSSSSPSIRQTSPAILTPSTASTSASPPIEPARQSSSRKTSVAPGTQHALPQAGPPTSSLTTLPTSSLTTLPDTLSFSSTSAKHVSRDGKEMVKNSDTESDSDASEELEDLDVILARANAKKSQQADALPASQARSSTSLARDRTLQSTRPQNAAAVKKPQPKYKFSLSSLVAPDALNMDDTDAGELDVVSDDGSDRSNIVRPQLVDDNAIESMMPDSGEEAEHTRRVLHAMQRAEAFKEELVYEYFDCTIEAPKTPPQFPVESCSRIDWSNMLRTPHQRQQMFSSGLAAKLFKEKTLPDEILSWILDSICSGASDIHSLRYLELIQQSPSRFVLFVDDHFFERHLDRMGAVQKTSLNQASLMPKRMDPSLLPQGLRWFLEALRVLLSHISCSTATSMIEPVCRILLDSRVCKDGFMLTLVQETMTDLLQRLHGKPSDIERVQRSIVKSWQLPSLQEALIKALPASHESTHAFRRQLAYAFSLSEEPPASDILLNPSQFMFVIKHLRSLSKQTQQNNFADLASNIAMLDVAIDGGFSDRDWRQDPEARTKFDGAVSRLAAAVRELESSLIGGGLSNLHKSAAKAALDRLWYRLQYSVRTTPPPQKDYFGGFEAEQARKVQFMGKWAKAGHND